MPWRRWRRAIPETAETAEKAEVAAVLIPAAALVRQGAVLARQAERVAQARREVARVLERAVLVADLQAGRERAAAQAPRSSLVRGSSLVGSWSPVLFPATRERGTEGSAT